MLLSGTVIVDAGMIIEDGAVVTQGDRIVAVGDHSALAKQYPNHEQREYDILLPGVVGSHIHSVQSLGRGIADDTALLDWLFDYVLPMEAGMDADVMYTAAKLGYLECIESGTTTVIDHLSVHHADAAFEAAIDVGIRGRLGKVLMDKASPEGLQQSTQTALDETEELIQEFHKVNDGRIQYAITPRSSVFS